MNLCIVVFPAVAEVGGYVAACVEKNLVTQGCTIDDVHHSMEAVIATHVKMDLERGVPPLSEVPAAPDAYRRAFMAAERDLDLKPLPFRDICANDTLVSDGVQALAEGFRHYRYTERRPSVEEVGS